MMKGLIHGPLRLLLAVGAIYLFCHYFTRDYKPSTFFTSASTGDVVGVFVLLQLFSCFALYMGINGVRDLMRKRIRMRVMYVVNVLILLSIIFFAFFGKNDGNDKSEPASDWDFLYGLAFFAMVYFAIYDFIILFIKRKKYVEKKEPEFGMENIT